MRWAAAAAQSVWRADNTKPVKIPFDKMSKVVRPKGGNTGVIIAGAGVGKTMFLLNWVARSGMRVLYVSSDTSSHDLTAQLGALATGEERVKVEQRMMKDQVWRREYAAKIAREFPNLVVDFTPAPSMHQINQMCRALTELWGASPEMVVMDTASNVEMADKSNNAEWQRVWLEAIECAREHNLFWMFAHHVKQGPAREGRVAPTLADGLWGSDQFPEFVFGLHLANPKKLTLTVRKNRGGRRDVPINFDADFPKAAVTEHNPLND